MPNLVSFGEYECWHWGILLWRQDIPRMTGAPDLGRVSNIKPTVRLPVLTQLSRSSTIRYRYLKCRSLTRIHIQVLLPNMRIKTRINAGPPQTLMWSTTFILKITMASFHQVGSEKSHNRDPQPKVRVATTSRALGTLSLVPTRKEQEHSEMWCFNHSFAGIHVQYNISCT